MVSINNNISSTINSSLSSKTSEVIEAAKQTIQDAQQKPVQETSQTTLSSRGERLAALNQDFDITSSNFAITDDFLTRLEELEFISADQLASLQQEMSVNSSSDTESSSTLATIKQSTSDIIERFEDNEQADNLIEILNKAINIIDTFGQSSSSDISSTMAQLEQQINNTDGITLTEQEKTTLNELHSVLSIAETLNSQSRTSSNIDQYLQYLE